MPADEMIAHLEEPAPVTKEQAAEAFAYVEGAPMHDVASAKWDTIKRFFEKGGA